MEVVQGVEFQIVAVRVKAGFSFVLKRLVYSLLRGEVKGEGKKANSLSAQARIYAQARVLRVGLNGSLCGGGRF